LAWPVPGSKAPFGGERRRLDDKQHCPVYWCYAAHCGLQVAPEASSNLHMCKKQCSIWLSSALVILITAKAAYRK